MQGNRSSRWTPAMTSAHRRARCGAWAARRARRAGDGYLPAQEDIAVLVERVHLAHFPAALATPQRCTSGVERCHSVDVRSIDESSELNPAVANPPLRGGAVLHDSLGERFRSRPALGAHGRPQVHQEGECLSHDRDFLYEVQRKAVPAVGIALEMVPKPPHLRQGSSRQLVSRPPSRNATSER